MFRRTRERLDRIERALEALASKLEAPAAPSAAPSGDAIASLFGKMMTSQVDLVGAMGDLAVRSVARRNGIRGGAANVRTAQRASDGKFLPKRARRIERRAEDVCELCEDPMRRDVSIPMIQKHRAHEGRRYEPASHESGESDQGESAGPEYTNGTSPAGH